MGREVRRVPKDWQHPKDERSGNFIPLLDGSKYERDASEFMEQVQSEGLQAAIDYFGNAPNKDDYMPTWTDEQKTHYMMYENTSEGTPISHAFESPEQLARWLADTKASAFGDFTASYEGWLRVARGGWAPSAILIPGKGMISGVDAFKDDKP